MLLRQKEKKKKPKQTDQGKENERGSKPIAVQNILESGDFVHLIQTWHNRKWCLPEHYWTKPKGIRRELHICQL